MTLRKEKMELEVKKSQRPKISDESICNWHIAGISDLASRKQNFK